MDIVWTLFYCFIDCVEELACDRELQERCEDRRPGSQLGPAFREVRDSHIPQSPPLLAVESVKTKPLGKGKFLHRDYLPITGFPLQALSLPVCCELAAYFRRLGLFFRTS